MAKTFIVTEEDLFNFDEFCGSKYDDETCRKYGFFKVKLDAACAGQSSLVQDFFKQFGTPALSKVAKSVLLQNTNGSDKNLFGLQTVKSSQKQTQEFITMSRDPASFEKSPNCCLNALEDSEESFLQHFYAEVTKSSMMTPNNEELSAIQKRAANKKVAFEKRQCLKEAKTGEGKGRSLEMAMLTEKVEEPSSFHCHCDTCKSFQPCPEKSVDGDCLLYCAGVEETAVNFLYLTKNFAMAHLCYQNMLTDLDSFYGGVSYPALYLGGPHSIFPLHVEDLSLWSFNFNIHGHPKYWLIVPPTEVRRLADALCKRGFNDCNKWCRNLLGHKFYFPNVEFFKEENIPFKVVIQHAGEGIVVFPNAAHTGGNLGTNLAQACNFGNKQWLPYGAVAPSCSCMDNTVHADLTDLVAIHRPEILRAYLTNNIRNSIDDDYFQNSIIVPRTDLPYVSQSSSLAGISRLSKGAPSMKIRLKCPLCNVTWSSPRKTLLLNHLQKHHGKQMKEKVVCEFMYTHKLN